jgi:hypothetical protein
MFLLTAYFILDIQKTLQNLALPPAEWADEVANMHAQLIVSLEELAKRENELTESAETMRRFHGQLLKLKDQKTMIVREYITLRSKVNIQC